MGYSFIEIAQGKPERDAQEQQARIDASRQDIQERDIQLGRMRKEDTSGLQDKDIQRRGLDLDIQNSNLAFEKALTEQKQGIVTADLVQHGLDSQARATAGVWQAFKNGNKPGALKALNKAHFIHPGEEFSDMSLQDSAEKGPDGKPIQQLVLTPKGEGKAPVMYPVPALDQIAQKYGARYEKLGDGTLIRIGFDGKAEQLFQVPKYKENTETGIPFEEHTGQDRPAAVYGVRPFAQPVQPQPTPRSPAANTGMPTLVGSTTLRPGDTPQANQSQEQPAQPDTAAATAATYGTGASAPQFPPLTRRQETHIDTRVAHGTAIISKYFTENPVAVDQKSQADVVNRMGQLVRSGQDPETAANTAIAEARRQRELARAKRGGAAPAAQQPGALPRLW
jgi:hypothetical protein